MMTQRKIKIIEFSNNPEIRLSDLREAILDYYGYKQDASRKLVITEIKDDHGLTGTIIFSLEGSPPKGVAVGQRFSRFSIGNDIRLDLIFIGNCKVSKPIIGIIIKNYDKDKLNSNNIYLTTHKNN